ncbi:MAG: DUF1610 domain-containing protein [Nanoarchaeota archaeon]|nr:DUF1610 domain-containing protein [Nanoarchaeota archaeon]MBU1135198.1 DUF1610 domain-containing protein [Nanoarchaeota archaeon]MBU2519771.1 DUF1610 domain-containing protein [Nanoarchaeota archaeon]
MKCTSCGRGVETEKYWVKFTCPDCGKVEIIRCEKCKNQSNQYTCKCGFTGP